MKALSIDLETYSSTDLNRCGVYRYVEDPEFEILLFGYSVDGGPVRVIDLACGESIPIDILLALSDDGVTKFAFNANFERICLSRFLGMPTGRYLDPRSWRCAMVWSAYAGLPLSLESVGAVLNLDKQKLPEGRDLIRYFCCPCAPTKSNDGRTRNLPSDAPEKWERFKKYNTRDVETEMSIQQKLAKFPAPEFVWDEYHIDQRINDRGVRLDLSLVETAIEMNDKSRVGLKASMRELTGLGNPNSVSQLKSWLAENDVEVDTLGKKDVKELQKTVPTKIADVLSLRQQLAKSSIKKYQAMLDTVCSDGRARGMFQFYGANRTGRWAGRHIQLQNLPQNHLTDLDGVRTLVRNGDYQAISRQYKDMPDTLSQLIRTAFVPKEGFQFFVADFSAIEARVLAWLAGETWRQDVFAQGKDIYCASASAMFRVPVEKNGINGHLRQKGKIAELALGYGGSVGALTAMGALDMGLTNEELQPLVDAWRKANPHIVKLWYDIGNATMDAIRNRKQNVVRGIRINCIPGQLLIRLPSGRELHYVEPRIAKNRFGCDGIQYEGITEGKWGIIDTYGAKLVENIVQGIACDILCHAMRTLQDAEIVMHIHDELVIEAPSDTSLDDICTKMAITPPWAPGLVLRADGYITDYYKKE